MSKVTELIQKKHNGDQRQLDIIFSNESRLVVEAPAGCGKTTTMVSKVAYLLAEKKIPKNKKILALTFSVNAAYKMKKDIAEQLPLMGIPINAPNELNSIIYISNYHGLSRKILSHYGYLIDDRLREINDFQAFNENSYNVDQLLEDLGLDITLDEKELFHDFGNAIKVSNEAEIHRLIDKYNSIILDKVIPNKCVTFNAYLTLTLKLFTENNSLKRFYQMLYPMIIVDEFQDTNILSWLLLDTLINDETKLFFMGDSLQRIYGFIGAIPNLLNTASAKYNMIQTSFERNYRFKDNSEMLKLDKNLRENAANCYYPQIRESAVVPFHVSASQETEAEAIVALTGKLLVNGETVSILVQQRGANIDIIMNALDNANIDYFYALFSEEDNDYIEYHKIALKIFFECLARYRRVNKALLKSVISKIEKYYEGYESKIVDSLMILTGAFFERLLDEYLFLDNDEKIAFISDTLENRALKQNMDLISSNVFVATVHGAKGLEWDNVIVPDLEPYCFPNYPSLCGKCREIHAGTKIGNHCKIHVIPELEKDFLEELSLFYVAVTRARKKLYLSASVKRYNNNHKEFPSQISCLPFLPGVALKFD